MTEDQELFWKILKHYPSRKTCFSCSWANISLDGNTMYGCAEPDWNKSNIENCFIGSGGLMNNKIHLGCKWKWKWNDGVN